MKISRRQLRRIILEAVSKQLHAKELSYGGMYVETGAGDNISMGEMIQKLLDSGDEEFFDTGDGKNQEGLDTMLTRHKEGVQGGMEKWDSDVFSQYYDVNLVKVVSRYANLNGFDITWLGEDGEMPSDIAWREQNTSAESALLRELSVLLHGRSPCTWRASCIASRSFCKACTTCVRTKT